MWPFVCIIVGVVVAGGNDFGNGLRTAWRIDRNGDGDGDSGDVEGKSGMSMENSISLKLNQ